MSSIKELMGGQLKAITSSFKNCVFIDLGWKITDSGNITFDFAAFQPNEIEIVFKRISGDGNLTILSGRNEYNVKIISKISQSCLIKTENSIINLCRPNISQGEIVILGFKIHYNEDEYEGNILKNWKMLIKQCGKYSYLTLVNNRLLAASGAFIENGLAIKEIETVPPNMSKLEDGKLIFLGACEIVRLEVSDNIIKPITAHNLFDHRDQPTQSLSPNPVPVSTIQRQLFLYDSIDAKEFNKTSSSDPKSIKFIKSNGQDFLLIKRTGSFSIPMSWVQPHTEYTITISGKILNGNGKIQIGFTNSKQSINFGTQIFMGFDTVIEMNSGNPPNLGESYYLTIRMPDNGTGEVLISRIQLSVTSDSNVEEEKENKSISNNHSYPSLSIALDSGNDKKFVIVIPSYNNVKWSEHNINSVINQNYNNYRIIYTDDDSSDGTFEKVSNIVQASIKKDKFTLIKNTKRCGALQNLYNMIHSCDDDEIILTLDGDDWLAHSDVLNKLNNIYSSENIWMTYGQYQNYPDKGTGIAQAIPDRIIHSNSFRDYTWCASHLRTFYSWLFKSIDKKSLMHKNAFMSMTWDLAIMFPMLEMSGVHSKYISDILYIYNMDNPINDHKVNKTLQQNLDRYVRTLPKYKKLDRPTKKNITVGLFIIATGKYQKFIQGLITSADQYFLNGCNVTYYIFSDTTNDINSTRPIVNINIEHKSFPFASMDRFKHFVNHSDKYKKEDYLFYVDVDCLFVDSVAEEIVGDLVGVQHCGFLNTNGPVEDNPTSVLYVNESYPKAYKNYYGGGFSGGKRESYLKLSKWCSEMIDQDVDKGIIPRWHDETALNRYFLDNPPSIILSPSYHFPQGQKAHYQKIWGNHTFKSKILLLDKNHASIRN